MAHDRLVADRHHRLRNAFRVFPDPGAKPAATPATAATPAAAGKLPDVLTPDDAISRYKADKTALMGKRIKIKFSRALPYELDGGARGAATELKVKVAPASITICVPDPADQ